MTEQKRILVAPLNWGLGHATRCIPLIRELLRQNYEVIIGSDGMALELLIKEFPECCSVKLPSYKITYSKKGKNFKRKLLLDTPKIAKAIRKEKKEVKKLVKSLKLDGIISDNRLGVYHKKVPSVFITHQLNVLSGNTTWLSSKVHKQVIKKFDECWVPDHEKKPNLSGKLGHLKKSKLPLKYIGPLSRFQADAAQEKDQEYELCIVLSGPEPQRNLLEEKILHMLKDYHEKTLLIRGVIQGDRKSDIRENLFITDFMTSCELEEAIKKSRVVLSRSGYTTIMDLAKLGKKAFFIPTPGQFEQEYLAKRLDKLKLVPSCSQEKFKLEKLSKVEQYQGFGSMNFKEDYTDLFGLFEGK